jgi:hypothetical protein
VFAKVRFWTLGLLDHSVTGADRAANLGSDSTDGEAGCSESGDLGA